MTRIVSEERKMEQIDLTDLALAALEAIRKHQQGGQDEKKEV